MGMPVTCSNCGKQNYRDDAGALPFDWLYVAHRDARWCGSCADAVDKATDVALKRRLSSVTSHPQEQQG